LGRPILRLAMRLTRRTRTTAWAVAFACMVLVGSLALVDGLRAGADSVAGRFETGPAVYIRGTDLLESRIPLDGLAGLPDGTEALRVRAGVLEINGLRRDVIVGSEARLVGGTWSTAYPTSSSDLSIDVGLQAAIEAASGRPLEAAAQLTLFSAPPMNVSVVPPPPVSLELLPDSWAWARPELFAASGLAEGLPVQALVSDGPLDPSLVSSLGLSRLEVLGAVAFFRGGLEEAGSALSTLALLIAVVIGLLVYSAMSLEVHGRAAEIRTLRSLGAGPASVAGIYEGQALTLVLLGAGLGSALGVVVAHAVVSFAPLLGLPNVVLLGPPVGPFALALLTSAAAGAVAGIAPSLRAASLARPLREVGRS